MYQTQVPRSLLAGLMWVGILATGFAQDTLDQVALRHEAGVDSFERGDFAESVRSWSEARRFLAKRKGMERGEITILVNLSHAYTGLGNAALGFRRLEEAAQLANKIGDARLMARVRGLQGAMEAFGDDTIGHERKKRRVDIPAVETEWALTQLEALLAFLESPRFGRLTPEEQSRLMGEIERLSRFRATLAEFALDPIWVRIEAAVDTWASRDKRFAGRLLDETEERLGKARPIGDAISISTIADHTGLLLYLAFAYEKADQDAKFDAVVERARRIAFEVRREPLDLEGLGKDERRTYFEMFVHLVGYLNQIPGETYRRHTSDCYAYAEAAVPDDSDWTAAADEMLATARSSDLWIPKTKIAAYTERGRNARGWRGFLRGGGLDRLPTRDRRIMDRLAHGYLPDAVQLAETHLLMVPDSGPRADEHLAAGLEALAQADEVAEALFDAKLALEVKRVYGAFLALAEERGGKRSKDDYKPPKPEHRLLAAWAAAQRAGDKRLEASVLNDLGIALSTREKTGIAAFCFRKASAMAEREGEAELAARAMMNRARATGGLADLDRAAGRVDRLPTGHAKSLMRLGLADAYEKKGQVARSYKYCEAALRTANASKDAWAASYALGLLGKVYMQRKRFGDAEKFTREALWVAQSGKVRGSSPDSERRPSRDLEFRWTWQTAELQKRRGQRKLALETYDRAERLLTTIRRDMVIGYGLRGPEAGFRHELGPFYDQVAELHFANAEAKGESGARPHLVKARNTMERFKSALLEDYFRDLGMTTHRQRWNRDARSRYSSLWRYENEGPTRPVTKVAERAGQTGVLYIIPLEKETHLLLEIGGKLVWKKAPIGNKELGRVADEMIFALNPTAGGDTGQGYLRPAQRLYKHLIRPIRRHLTKDQTLVVVPDGKLRGVPMAALHDGSEFLAKNFAIATVPDLLLIDDHRTKTQKLSARKPLLVGLSEAVQGFQALPGVAEEIEAVDRGVPRRSARLLNEGYRKASFAAAFPKNYNLVHVASHANFSSDLDDTYVLTFDDKLGPRNLEDSVRKLTFQERPLNLLVLSACETAVGDDRATLGLAGIAAKSGTHSVVASLWPVDDRATHALMERFYHNLFPQKDEDLKSSKKTLSKAEALRRAQNELRRTWDHPSYWAPFMVIGNWLSPEDDARINKGFRADEIRERRERKRREKEERRR